jgi:hypothetical protein
VAIAVGLLLGVGVGTAGGLRAWAQTPAEVEAYQSALDKADAFWAAKKYAQARAEYERAYQIHPEPILLFNIASTYRRQGLHKQALQYYERFLDVAPAEEPRRALAAETVQHLRDAVRDEQEAVQNRGVAGQNPRAGAKFGGKNENPVVGGGPGADEQEESSAGGTVFMWSGVATAAVGFGALGYGLFEGKQAMDRNKEFQNLMAGQEWTPELQSRYDQGKAFERRAIIFSIVGGAAVATGATLFYLGWRERRGASSPERTVTVLPYAGENGTGMAVLGRF